MRHENVVLEITETASINYEAVKYLQKQGFLIALDDIGVGIRSLENLVKIQPNFIKIDKSLTQAENFKARDSLIKAFIDHSKRTEAQIIAEGIEKESHLEAIKKCGIILGQGYYLGKPELID